MRLADHGLLLGLRSTGWSSTHVPTGSGAIHVLHRRGRGTLPPVVVLHGLSSWGAHYAGLLRPLARHCRRVIAPDLLGHGFSTLPGEGLNPDNLARTLVQALDAVLDEPAVLFGNSLGGAGALRYALERPERVAGLVLLSPGGAEMTREEAAGLQQRFTLRSHTEALGFVDALFDYRHPMRHLLAAGVRYNFRQARFRDLVATFADTGFFEPEALRALPMPVLLVWGGAERILPDSGRAFFERYLPSHARIVRPDRFGHAAFIDQPANVARQILEFTAELTGVDVGSIGPPLGAPLRT